MCGVQMLTHACRCILHSQAVGPGGCEMYCSTTTCSTMLSSGGSKIQMVQRRKLS